MIGPFDWPPQYLILQAADGDDLDSLHMPRTCLNEMSRDERFPEKDGPSDQICASSIALESFRFNDAWHPSQVMCEAPERSCQADLALSSPDSPGFEPITQEAAGVVQLPILLVLSIPHALAASQDMS